MFSKNTAQKGNKFQNVNTSVVNIYGLHIRSSNYYQLLSSLAFIHSFSLLAKAYFHFSHTAFQNFLDYNTMQHSNDVMTDRNPAKYYLSKTMLQNRVQQIPQVVNYVLTAVICIGGSVLI